MHQYDNFYLYNLSDNIVFVTVAVDATYIRNISSYG